MTSRRSNKPRRIITSPEELPYICNAAEAGLLIRQNPETVQRMARDGVLPGRKQGQAWFFRRDDLLQYIDKLFDGAAR
jgi:hypothetical protein